MSADVFERNALEAEREGRGTWFQVVILPGGVDELRVGAARLGPLVFQIAEPEERLGIFAGKDVAPERVAVAVRRHSLGQNSVPALGNKGPLVFGIGV